MSLAGDCGLSWRIVLLEISKGGVLITFTLKKLSDYLIVRLICLGVVGFDASVFI